MVYRNPKNTKMKKREKRETRKMDDVKSLQIAKRMRDLRLSQNLTQLEFSKVIGVSPPAVGAIENALYLPNLDILKIIKEKWGINYDYILDGEIENYKEENERLKKEVIRLQKMVDKLLK